MTRDQIRTFAQNHWPVVQAETGAHGPICYEYIREIKVVYASAEELRRGFPKERLAVLLGDRGGNSFTEVQAKDLRIPTDDEAIFAARGYFITQQAIIGMLNGINEMREQEVL